MAMFRLDEVLQLAMQAEETGRLLYEATAAEAKDAKAAALCRQLASQEKAHYEKFRAMKEGLPVDYAARRLSLEEMEFVSSLVQGKVVPLEAEARRIARSNSLAQILDLAIQAERDSQAFYRQIMAEVDSTAAGTIREIIAEEARHEQILTKVRSEIAA